MQNSIWIAVFLLIILPMLERRRRRNAIIKHVLYNKKRNKENNKMKELARQFIGKECIVYTVTWSDGIVKGTIKDVADDGIIIERGDGIEAVNLDYVTRIREWPRNANGKKKAKKQNPLQKKGFFLWRRERDSSGDTGAVSPPARGTKKPFTGWFFALPCSAVPFSSLSLLCPKSKNPFKRRDFPLAQRKGFEPLLRFPVNTISSRAP